MRLRARKTPRAIKIRPATKTIGITRKTTMPMYGLLACPRSWVGRANSQEKPAVVTSAAPSMLIQWLEISIRIGRFGSSLIAFNTLDEAAAKIDFGRLY